MRCEQVVLDGKNLAQIGVTVKELSYLCSDFAIALPTILKWTAIRRGESSRGLVISRRTAGTTSTRRLVTRQSMPVRSARHGWSFNRPTKEERKGEHPGFCECRVLPYPVFSLLLFCQALFSHDSMLTRTYILSPRSVGSVSSYDSQVPKRC